MKAVNQKAQTVLNTLIEGLDGENNHKKVDNSQYMAVVVERIHKVDLGQVYSIAHYYTQNGDLMADPEMEVIKADIDGKYYPYTYKLDGMGMYQESLVFEEDKIVGIRPRQQREHAEFMGIWMSNIKAQQKI